MNPDDPILPPGALAVEYIADDVVIWSADDALIYRCPWCYRNLKSQQTDGTLKAAIECRVGAGHVIRFTR